MAYEARDFVTWRYTTDRGTFLSYKILKEITDQKGQGANSEIPLVGGSAATGVELRPGLSFRPRVALLWNVANKLARRVICFTPTSIIYVGSTDALENQLSLHAGHSGETFVFKCYGYEGERDRSPRPKV